MPDSAERPSILIKTADYATLPESADRLFARIAAKAPTPSVVPTPALKDSIREMIGDIKDRRAVPEGLQEILQETQRLREETERLKREKQAREDEDRKLDEALRENMPLVARQTGDSSARDLLRRAGSEPQKGLTRRAFLGAAAAAVVGLTAANALVGAALVRKSGEGSVAAPKEPEEPAPKIPEGPINLFEELIKPFVGEALKRRAERAKTDPEFYHRVDKELNENRINILLFGYSEEHGQSYEDYGGAPTILSYDRKTNQIGVVHLSRDIRVPELERLFPSELIENQRVRSIFKKGGFPLMQKISEDITGLAMDLQFIVKDTVARDVIAQLTDGKLVVDVPKDHETGPFRLDRKEYGPGFIPKGEQEMDTMQLMRYILAEDANPQGKEDERSYRKNDVLRQLSKKVKEKIRQKPLFILTVLDFITKEVRDDDIKSDFDLINLLSQSGQLVRRVLGAVLSSISQGKKLEIGAFPEEDEKQQTVIHDPFFGDGSVLRVHHIKDVPSVAQNQNPRVKDEISKGLLPDWMLIPDGGDPYAADLVTDYWAAVRKLVKEKLSAGGGPGND